MGLFSLDGPIYRLCQLIYETVILNLLWIIGSIPVVTIGVSTSALYYVYGKKERGIKYEVFKDFWKGYRENFKQSLIVGSGIIIILAINIFNILNLSRFGRQHLLMLSFQLFITIQILLVSLIVFPLIARFRMGIKDIIKNSLLLAYKHILTSLSFLLILAFFIAFTIFIPSFIFAIFGFYGLISAHIIERIFKKYMENTEEET